MKRLYLKNELFFALVWIAIYVISISLADSISETVGILKVITAPVALLLALFLFFWIKKNSLQKYYGLQKIDQINYRHYLYFLPLIILSTANLWNGIAIHDSFLEIALFIVCMGSVGFLEEVIFRGFLFKALSKRNVRSAIIISSVTFGLGHIVNLLNGAAFLPTMLQIGYATAIGFLFTILFLKSRILLPGILAHVAINATSIFAVSGSGYVQLISSIAVIALSVGYAIYLLRISPEEPV